MRGSNGRRKETLTRIVGTVACKAVAVLEIACDECTAPCGCCSTFRTNPECVQARIHYDYQARQLVPGGVLEDGMSIERVPASLRREYLLELCTGFVHDTLRDHAARLETWPCTAARCWRTSAARPASMSSIWAGSRCSWQLIPRRCAGGLRACRSSNAPRIR